MSFVFSCLLYFFFVVLSFFFFKQKTAYEMRISDWSSDVCSSDLYSRPQLGENIGKAARAMLNFGLVEMRLVSPRDGWPNPDAGPSAAGADVVLDKAEVFGTLADAVADCAHVYATTVRKRGVTKPVVTPEEAAREIHAEVGRGQGWTP